MIPEQEKQLKMLEGRLRGAGMSRRQFLKVAAAASAGTAVVAGIPRYVGASGATGRVPAWKAANAQPDEEQIFYSFGFREDPNSFDFNLDLYAAGEPEVWAGLLTFDADLNAVPDWAERWEPNEDASVWTFYIRQNNNGWTNGDPVTAHDFVWSWRRQLDPANAASYAFFLYDIKYAQELNTGSEVTDENDPLFGQVPTAEDIGARALDDWTLEVEMAGPRGYFPQVVAYLAAVPAHRPSVEEHGDRWALGGDIPLVSNGPFKLDLWQNDVRIEISRNENYWDAENIALEKVVEPIIPGPQTVLNYEQGNLDWAPIPATDLPRFQDDPELAEQLERYVYPGIWKIVPSNGIPPFDQIEVRRALSHAIDRDRIVALTNGLAQPAHVMMPTGVFGYFDDPEINDIQRFDPELAMAQLEGTEFEGGQNWPAITMSMRAAEEQYNSNLMATDIVAQLKEHLNMDIELDIIPLTSFAEQQFQNRMQLIWIRWWYDYPDPNNGYGDMFYSRKTSGKRQSWSNDEFDDLVEAGRAESDPEARLEIYKQAERVMQEDVAYIPVVYRVDQYAFKPWVKGLAVNQQGFVVPEGNIYLRMFTDVYIEGRPQD